jgi:hypothetical protein
MVEDLDVWFPGQPTTFRVKPLGATAPPALTLKTTLNGKTAQAPFAAGR